MQIKRFIFIFTCRGNYNVLKLPSFARKHFLPNSQNRRLILSVYSYTILIYYVLFCFLYVYLCPRTNFFQTIPNGMSVNLVLINHKIKPALILKFFFNLSPRGKRFTPHICAPSSLLARRLRGFFFFLHTLTYTIRFETP